MAVHGIVAGVLGLLVWERDVWQATAGAAPVLRALVTVMAVSHSGRG